MLRIAHDYEVLAERAEARASGDSLPSRVYAVASGTSGTNSPLGMRSGKRRDHRRLPSRGLKIAAPSIAGVFADKAPLKKSRRSGTKVAFNGEVTCQRNQWPSHFVPLVGRRLLMTFVPGQPIYLSSRADQIG